MDLLKEKTHKLYKYLLITVLITFLAVIEKKRTPKTQMYYFTYILPDV